MINESRIWVRGKQKNPRKPRGFIRAQLKLTYWEMQMSSLYLQTIAAGFLMLTSPVAHADVSVQGTPEAVQVEAKNASIEEVLGALRDAFGLNHQSDIPLGRQVSGTYQGSLSDVLTRLLDGNSFVLKRSENTIQVVITSAGSKPIPGIAGANPFPFPLPETKASSKPPVSIGMALPPPGPPCRNTMGSGLGVAVAAFARTTSIRIVRPFGTLRFSGTVR